MARKKKKGERGYEKQEVIDAFMESYRGLPCEVCGSTYMTCGHHFVGKGYCPRHIVTPENMIVVCQKHHGPYGKSMNPHSGNPFLVKKFNAWVAEFRGDVLEWSIQHKNDTVQQAGKIDWIGLYEAIVHDATEKGLSE